MGIKRRSINESDRDEVLGLLRSMKDATYQFPQISHEGLEALRDVIGMNEMERLMSYGLTEADAYRYAKTLARAMCSIILQTRSHGGLDPLALTINGMALGYERGIRDVVEMGLSPEAAWIISDKVDREEDNGREIEMFRRELEEL
ncbi:MAG: hypothetical protein J6D34_09330 [Atopobiaceae bacterium]|nr:hypothetical protein [Atopobiaceae bacterium]